jgi:cytochrome b561
MPPSPGYSRRQILLHWATVLVVAAQYVLHEPMADAFEIGLDTGSFSFAPGVVVHVALGTLILGLATWRLLLRQERPAPPPPPGEPPLFQRLSKLAHLGFYVLLIVLPVTGALAWGGKSETLGEVHGVLRIVLLVLILAHVGAVIVHQTVWKTGLITRMITPQD